MQRMQVYLTDEQRRVLGVIAQDEQRPLAEVLRNILDTALGLGDDKEDRLRALRESFGCLADERDPNEWLHEVRGRSADERLRDLGL